MSVTKADIIAKVDSAVVASKDEAAIAAAFSVGRTKLAERLIGIGTILETLGVTAGNAFLDAVFAAPEFKYVKILIERGELNVGSNLVQATIDSLVPSVLSTSDANKLKALGVVPDPISSYDVAAAFERG